MATNTVQPTTLQGFILNQATHEEQQIISENWNSYIRNAMAVGKKDSHVWPMNVEYALRATLNMVLLPQENVGSQVNVFSDYRPNLETLTIEQFLALYDSESRYIEERIPRSTPRFQTAPVNPNDPSVFPPSSVVYRDARVLDSVIGVINGVISNLEQAYRRLKLRIVSLENDVQTQNETYYLTESFQRKFQLYK